MWGRMESCAAIDNRRACRLPGYPLGRTQLAKLLGMSALRSPIGMKTRLGPDCLFSDTWPELSRVPHKRALILAAIVLAPVPGALQLLDLALHQVALQRADVVDVQLPVKMIGLVQKRPRQQIFRGLLEHLALRVLRPDGHGAAAPHLLAESRNTQTALFAVLLAIHSHDGGVEYTSQERV